MPVDTDDAIHAIHRSLQSSHECTVSELGKNFYKNYAEFVKVAQEADKFESDLNTMRAMISQLKGFSNDITGVRDIFEQVTIVEEGGNVETPQLSTIETVPAPKIECDPELQAKLKRITDLVPEALKYVEETKFVLMESSTMAIYLEKQWKPAQIWLLSNGCLIASRKAKVSLTQGVRHKLTFERFYHVDALQISDVKDTADLENCFKLKNVENGSIFLHTESEEEKSNLMQLIQKIIQDHLDQQQQTKPSDLAGKLFKTEANKSTHRRTSSACTSGTVSRPSLYDSCFDHQELSPDSFNNFEKTLEDLSEALSCTNYDYAIDLVEKRKNTEFFDIFNMFFVVKFDFDKVNFTSPLVNSLKIKFNELRNQLASFLFIEISDPLINQTKMVAHIQKLIILGFIEEARERFFISQSELIKAKMLKIQYYGDVFASVALLSSITFESIETAFAWFNQSFMDAKLMSAFVSWSRNEISHFCEIFSKQALRKDLSMEILSECIQDALNKCRNLGQCGLDLSIFLEDCLGETLKNALKSRASLHLLRVDEALQKDSFEFAIAFDRPDWPKDLFPPNAAYKATEASLQLVQSIQDYLADVLPLMKTPQLASFCVEAVYDFIDSFSEKFLQSFYLPNRSNTQLCHISANMEVISRVLLPNLMQKFPSNTSALIDLQKRLVNTSDALYVLLSEQVAKSLLPNEFSSYSKISGSMSSKISDWIEKAIPVLAKLSRDSSDFHRKKTIDQCAIKILSIFKSALTSELIKFPNAASLHQLVLDLKLLLHIINSMVSGETKELYEQVIDMATKNSVNNLDQPLPSGTQMENEVNELVKSFSEFEIDFK